VYWQKLPFESLKPKWVLDGFPKAGLHLAELMLSPVAQALPPDGLFNDSWIGTFRGNAWTNEWLPLRTITYRIARAQCGRYVKGHLGHSEELEQFLYYLGAAVVFVYRDLRDVAVSQAHHLLNPDDVQYKHPNKAIYQELGSFEAALQAVIEGVGPYPGVIQRWEQYATWLDCKWVCKMPFETMREKPLEAARILLEYGLRRTTASIGLEIRLDDQEYEQMAQAMAAASEQRQASPTFRKGTVGGWRDVFTDEHKRAFKAVGGDGWLVTLGYERDEEW